MRHVDTAAALADAMRARVRDVEAGDAFLDAVAFRARRPRHGALTAVGAAAAALVVVGGGVAVGRVAGDLPRDVVTATSAPPAPSASPAPARPRVVATRVPRGWDRRPHSTTSTRMETRGEGVVYAESVAYRPLRRTDGGMTSVRITTTSGAVPAVEASVGVTARYDGTIATERVRPVRIGDRLVFPLVHEHRGSDRGVYSYKWTEAPGVNVSVFAIGSVTAAEVRTFVRHARLAG